jgi:heme/copper-type cytochrome/quinol oxidase subunit 3
MDFLHITGIDVMFFAALFAAYLRYRYPERPDPQVQRIRELVRAGCWAMAADEARKWFGEESEGL